MIPVLLLSLSVVDVGTASAATKAPHRTATSKAATKRACTKHNGHTMCRSVSATKVKKGSSTKHKK
jgi:hypothetical protein